jgi:hypothetical protein
LSRILYYDIEWKPGKAYIWQPWDVNVSPSQMIDPGGLLCFSALWSDTNEVIFKSEWEDGHDDMVKTLHSLLSEADAVVTFNGDKYDNKKAMGEFLLAGLPPPPPITSIDLLKTVKKMGFIMNRLAFIGPFLKIGAKVKHEGFELWTAVEAGDAKAQRRMKRYCIQDTKLLVKLYNKIKPYITTHPHLGTSKHQCGACESNKVQSRGFRRTKEYLIQRLQCTSCGSWQTGTRKKVV